MRGPGARALFVLGIVIFGAAFAGSGIVFAGASTFTVNDNTDSNSAAAIAACQAPPAPGCTLRAAITAANQETGLNNVNVDPTLGPYVLTLAGADEDDNDTGDLDILDDVRINGDPNGTGTQATIDQGGLVDDRVLHIVQTVSPAFVPTVTLQWVHITGGNTVAVIAAVGPITVEDVSASAAVEGQGGGIFNDGDLTLDNSLIEGNTVTDGGQGGGIFNAAGSLTLNTTNVNGNTAGPAVDGHGGGIFNQSGAVSLINGSFISSNHVGADSTGGGIDSEGGSLTIDGLGSGLTGNSMANGSLGAGIYAAGTTVLIKNNANVTSNTGSAGSSPEEGGGIYSSGGSLTIDASTIQNNTLNAAGSKGAGISRHGAGTFRITNGSQVTSNVIGSSGAGAGIAVISGSISIDESFVQSNYSLSSTTLIGGGIYLDTPTLAVITKTDISFNNGAGIVSGGGIAVINGPLRVSASSIDSNGGGDSSLGGGIYASGATVTLMLDEVGGNSIGNNGNGGGLYALSSSLDISQTKFELNNTGNAGLGGGVYSQASTGAIQQSTISDNYVPLAGKGAGIYVISGLAITNSTISGNVMASGEGAGVYAVNGITLSSDTIARNDAGSPGSGDGIDVGGGGNNVRNTIIAEPVTNTSCGQPLNSLGYNLDDDGSCGFTNTGDIQNGNANLDALHFNGGNTRTHRPMTGSDALENGNPAAPGSGGNSCPAIDQRGEARPAPSFGRCDIGAYEEQYADPAICATETPTPTPVFADTPAPSPCGPTLTPSPSPTPTPTPTPSPTLTPPPGTIVTPTPTPTPTLTPTGSPGPSGTIVPTPTPTATPTATPTESPPPTDTPTTEPTEVVTATPPLTPTPTSTRTSTPPPSASTVPHATPTPTPGPTIVLTPTPTGTPRPGVIARVTASPPRTATPIRSSSATPTRSPLRSGSPAVTASPAPTASPIAAGVTEPTPGPTTGAQASVPRPFRKMADLGDISTDPAVIGTNLLLAIIMLGTILVCSNLFNGVIAENFEEVPATLQRLASPFKRLGSVLPKEAGGARTPLFIALTIASFVVVLVLNGGIYTFLDPEVGWNNETLVMFLSLVIGVALITYVYAGSQTLLTTRRYRIPAGIKVFPIALGIAVVSVIVSRLTGFQPGIVLGFVASYRLLSDATMEEKQDGEVVFYPSLILMAFCLIAWILIGPARQLTGDSESWVAALPEATLTVIFIGGLEGLFFNLFPVSFLDGSYVWGWSKWRWVLVMGLSAFLYWEVLLNKAGAYDDVLSPTSGLTAAIVITICVVLAGGAWLYFKTRPEDEEPEPA